MPHNDSDRAQWTVTSLHPAGKNHVDRVFNLCRAPRGQCPFRVPVQRRLWSGSADSFVSLSPNELIIIFRAYMPSPPINKSGLSRQRLPGGTPVTHASLWSGTAAWVDLHPAGASHSEANGVSGAQQVGTVTLNGELRPLPVDGQRHPGLISRLQAHPLLGMGRARWRPSWNGRYQRRRSRWSLARTEPGGINWFCRTTCYRTKR